MALSVKISHEGNVVTGFAFYTKSLEAACRLALQTLRKHKHHQDLQGKKVTITATPRFDHDTREPVAMEFVV